MLIVKIIFMVMLAGLGLAVTYDSDGCMNCKPYQITVQKYHGDGQCKTACAGAIQTLATVATILGRIGTIAPPLARLLKSFFDAIDTPAGPIRGGRRYNAAVIEEPEGYSFDGLLVKGHGANDPKPVSAPVVTTGDGRAVGIGNKGTALMLNSLTEQGNTTSAVVNADRKRFRTKPELVGVFLNTYPGSVNGQYHPDRGFDFFQVDQIARQSINTLLYPDNHNGPLGAVCFCVLETGPDGIVAYGYELSAITRNPFGRERTVTLHCGYQGGCNY